MALLIMDFLQISAPLLPLPPVQFGLKENWLSGFLPAQVPKPRLGLLRSLFRFHLQLINLLYHIADLFVLL